MEAEFSAFKTEWDNFNNVLVDCKSRIETLENDKQTQRAKIQQLHALSQTIQEEVDRL